MRQLLSALLLLGLCLPCEAGVLRRRGVAAAGGPASCTPVMTGHTWDETFDPTGYDLSWTECTTGCGSATLNEDLAVSGGCFATQGLRTDTNNPSGYAHVYRTFTLADPAYFRMYFSLSALPATGAMRMLSVGSSAHTCLSSGFVLVNISLTTAGVMELRSGGSLRDSYTLPGDFASYQWRLELKVDNAASVGWRIYKIVPSPFSSTSVKVNDSIASSDPGLSSELLCVGWAEAGTDIGIDWDNVSMHTTWVGE